MALPARGYTYVPVAQGAAGTTELAAAVEGKYHKVMAAILSIDATGTLKFVDDAGDLTGAMPVSTTGGFVAPSAGHPYTRTTTTNSSLSLTSVTGKVFGVVAILTSSQP